MEEVALNQAKKDKQRWEGGASGHGEQHEQQPEGRRALSP